MTVIQCRYITSSPDQCSSIARILKDKMHYILYHHSSMFSRTHSFSLDLKSFSLLNCLRSPGIKFHDETALLKNEFCAKAVCTSGGTRERLALLLVFRFESLSFEKTEDGAWLSRVFQICSTELKNIICLMLNHPHCLSIFRVGVYHDCWVT